MRFPFRSKKAYKTSTPAETPKPAAIESNVEPDDLADAFCSLSFSINSKPSAKSPVSSGVQILEPAPQNRFPIFPMAEHPQCRVCRWRPRYKNFVKADNKKGNVGRPFFICVKCKKNASADPYHSKISREVGWISWDDYIGVHERNPPCACGVVCRQDRAGPDSSCPGAGFWTCATGSCGFVSFRKDALTTDEAYRQRAPYDDGFEPWLL
ncbi:MAG: hypothetical protein Q9196_000367 [Gyalolechia fulgens]